MRRDDALQCRERWLAQPGIADPIEIGGEIVIAQRHRHILAPDCDRRSIGLVSVRIKTDHGTGLP